MRYLTGNLFDAPKGSYLLHACNCVGRWGSGVAAEFARRFPKAYGEYKARCKYGVKPGDIFISSEENGYRIIGLFTSKDYGDRVDSPSKIIEATKVAIRKLPYDRPIHMPKINSGLFRVPWENTAALFLEETRDITVWEVSP